LNGLCEQRSNLFGNTKKAIHEKYIHRLDHSLTLVRVTDFEVLEISSDDGSNRKKIRLAFTYNNDRYDFPVTDPVFKHNYQHNPGYLDDIEVMLLTLSVSVPFEGFHFKLVAGVIPI
jgi:hypothetical protein